MQQAIHDGLMKDPWRLFAIIIVAVLMMLLLCMKAAGWMTTKPAPTAQTQAVQCTTSSVKLDK